ncbi:MAG: 16S rRNA (cytosine(967)-C(5))-methyltransferase RsmB [Deltaproteobacteria bacterium]
MKVDTPRDLALRVLNDLSRKPGFSAGLLDHLFRARPDLEERDRAFISQLVQGAIRWRGRLDWTIRQASNVSLKRISPPVLNILRLALYQVLFLDRVPESAAVNEAVKQAKKGQPPYVVSFVNAVLRKVCRTKDTLTFPDRGNTPVEYMSAFHSYPEWLVRKWIREWGADFTETLLETQNRIPSLTIRSNPLKIDREALLRRLEEESGIAGKPTPYSPQGVHLPDFRGRVDQYRAFQEGLFQVQDEAAQLTSFLLSPAAGETVLDLCAGYGGKTTHIAELMGDRGKVIALDMNRARLISLATNTARLGIRSALAVGADASEDLSSLFRVRFDRIVVDAPCSGLGVLSRHPDGKWNKKEQDITRLAELQQAILNNGCSLLRSGGTLLYVTCTLSREENEEVVDACLEVNKDVALLDLKDRAPLWARDLIDDRGFLRTFPHLHGMDGFFGALMMKR